MPAAAGWQQLTQGPESWAPLLLTLFCLYVLSPTPGSAMVPCKGQGRQPGQKPCSLTVDIQLRGLLLSLMSPPHLPHQHVGMEMEFSMGLSLIMKLSGFIVSLGKERTRTHQGLMGTGQARAAKAPELSVL